MFTPWPDRQRVTRTGLIFAACFALTMLAMGGAAHLRHHLDDPSCDRGPTPESHACASCSNLHGGAMADAAPALASARIVWSPTTVAAVLAPPIRAAAAEASPRAPPRA